MKDQTVADVGTITDSAKAYSFIESLHRDIGCGTVSAILLDWNKRAVGVTSHDSGLSQGLGNIYDQAVREVNCFGVVVALNGQIDKLIQDYIPPVLNLRYALNSRGRLLIDVIIIQRGEYFSFADNSKHKLSE